VCVHFISRNDLIFIPPAVPYAPAGGRKESSRSPNPLIRFFHTRVSGKAVSRGGIGDSARKYYSIIFLRRYISVCTQRRAHTNTRKREKPGRRNSMAGPTCGVCRRTIPRHTAPNGTRNAYTPTCDSARRERARRRSAVVRRISRDPGIPTMEPVR